jgi:hypothetical protein
MANSQMQFFGFRAQLANEKVREKFRIALTPQEQRGFYCSQNAHKRVATRKVYGANTGFKPVWPGFAFAPCEVRGVGTSER